MMSAVIAYFRRLSWRIPQGWVETVRLSLLAERGRWPLWTPVWLGLGVGLAALLPAYDWWMLACLLLPLLGVCLWARQRGWVLWGLLWLLLGWTVALAEPLWAGTPMVMREHGPARIEGRVMALQQMEDGWRIVLDQVAVRGLLPDQTPRRVRLTLRGKAVASLPPVGARVATTGFLLPLNGPALPGGYDFRRHYFFQGIGAVGFSRSAVERIQPPAPRHWPLLAEQAREGIAARVRAVLAGDRAAITIALFTGEQAAISEATLATMRGAGIVHLLSISGTHIGLVAGIVFFVLRLLLVLHPRPALEWPTKKIAAFAALLAALAYTWLVGAPVPTIRSMLMTGLVLMAVMLDRRAISMALVALAALLVLVLSPHALAGPSFQLSFAAVLALVAGYEATRPQQAALAATGWWGRLQLYGWGIVLSSLLAGVATAPLVIFHFQQIVWYSVLGNLLAMPLTAFWIMPAGLVAALLMPLHLEGPALLVMGAGVEWLLASAAWVASLPAAVLSTPSLPLWGLLLIAAGGLWLCLWRARWRLFGVPLLLLGLSGLWLAPRPDVLVAADGQLVAVRLSDGRYALWQAGRGDDFLIEQWQQALGVTAFVPWSGVVDAALRCDGDGCFYQRGAARLLLAWHGNAIAEECGAAPLILASGVVDAALCPGAPILDQRQRWRHGALSLRAAGTQWQQAVAYPRSTPWW